MMDETTLTPSLSHEERGSEWSVDTKGALRTPAGMLVFRWTPAGDLEVLDRKLRRLELLPIRELLRLRAEWMSRG